MFNLNHLANYLQLKLLVCRR